MSFIYPTVLWGLLALLVPILIHLFNFRPYKKVFFSNTTFLKHINKQTKKQSQWRNLLILLFRLLAIGSIVIAFAQPYFPNELEGSHNSKQISVYVDNSLSMESLRGNTSLLEEAKRKARELVKGFSDTDQFQLLTNDLSVKHQRYTSKEEFIEEIQKIEFSNRFLSLENLYKNQMDLLPIQNKANYLFWISDFQRANLQGFIPVNDSLSKIYLLPLQRGLIQNISVDSVYLESPNINLDEDVKIKVCLKNYSDRDKEKLGIKLYVNDKLKSLAKIDIPANQNMEILMSYTLTELKGQRAYIEIDDFPIRFDDRLYFYIPVQKQFRVSEIYQDQKSDALASLFTKDSSFVYQSNRLNHLDYGSLRGEDLIILNGVTSISKGLQQLIIQNLKQGKSAFFIPNENGGCDNCSEIKGFVRLGKEVKEEISVNKIHFEHPLFRDVFERIPENFNAPQIYAYYKMPLGKSYAADQVLTLENGDPIVQESSVYGGRLFQSSVPLSATWTNLTKHALFVPLMYRMAALSTNPNPLFYIIGKPGIAILQVDEKQVYNGDFTVVLKDQEGLAMIPAQVKSNQQIELFTQSYTGNAGLVNLILKNGNNLGALAFNYDRFESDMNQIPLDELNLNLTDAGLKVEVLNQQGQKHLNRLGAELTDNSDVWKYFVILALGFLLLESLLLRYLKYSKK